MQVGEGKQLTLSQGVATLHVWYQLAGLASVLLLLWYSEEVAEAFPPYQDFHDVYIENVFDMLRIDMYLSDDYREVFSQLLLRHKMVMILQSGALCIMFTVLRKAISVVSREEEGLLEQLTSSKVGRYAITTLEILEVVLVVKNFATKSVLREMVPLLDRTVLENIYSPVMKWGWMLFAWWVANVVVASFLALFFRLGVLMVSGMYCPGKYGVRRYVVSFLVFRLLISAFWRRVNPDDPKTTSEGTLYFMVAKLVLINGIINIQDQMEASEGKLQEHATAMGGGTPSGTSPMAKQSSAFPGDVQTPFSAGLDAIQATVEVSSPLLAMSRLRRSGRHSSTPVRKSIPWDRVEYPLSRMIVIYLGRFRAILFQPLIFVMGSLILILTPNTLALLVVILFMYLVLIWTPASIIVVSTDYFVNTAGMAGFTWYIKYSDADVSVEDVQQMVTVFTTVVTCFVATSYAWACMGVFGVSICLLMLLLSVSDIVYSADVMMHVKLKFGLLWLLLAVVFRSKLPPLPSLIRSLTMSALSTVMVGGGLFSAYVIPHAYLPAGIAHVTVMLLSLLLIGVVKDMEANAKSLMDMFLFNIVETAVEKEQA